MQVKNFKTKCKKMLYIALGIFIIFVVYLASGCSIYHPTSYRAFIPKSLDSEYKEFERLCKEEVGRAIYARPIKQEGVKLEDLFNLPYSYFSLSRHIIMLAGRVETKQEDEPFYLYIAGFQYYTGWTQKSFSMHDDSKEYISCKPLLYGKDWEEESVIIKQKAFGNKKYIGDDIIYKEWYKIHHMDYCSSQKYISQIARDIIYNKRTPNDTQ